MDTKNDRLPNGLMSTFCLLRKIGDAVDEDHRRILDLAAEATRQYENRLEQLNDRLDSVRRAVDVAANHIEGGYPPNSLGILQGHGSDVDRLCGELALAKDTAFAAQKLADDLGVL